MKLILFKLMITLFMVQILQAQNSIVINEIMYNSSGNEVEYIELYNNSGISFDLHDWYILDDNDNHDHCLINWTLQPDSYLVIAGDVNQFTQKYSSVSQVNPNGFNTDDLGWSLSNSGDQVRLYDNTGVLQDEVAYSDGGAWPGSADGNGPSLELFHPALDNNLSTSWSSSTADEGTPGARNSVFTTDVKPTCKNGSRSIELPVSTDDVLVTVLAFDIEGLDRVDLFVNYGQGYTSQPMYDDGTNGDLIAGDSLFSSIISRQNSNVLVKYYAKAIDNIGQVDTWPNNAPSDYHAYTVNYTSPKLRITELLAVNNSINYDENGEYDDWVEICNAGTENVNLGGMFLSNSFGSSKSFELPSLDLAPNAYIIIWADNDTDQGALHANFKLSSAGEEVALFESVDHGNVMIHGWKYGLMSCDVSMGLKTSEGTAPEYLSTPTPGSSNETSELFSIVCINEFQTTSNYGGIDDWVEIFNRGTIPFDLSGCFLSDQRSNTTKWTFPQGAVLNPGSFLVIYEDALGFGFSSDGDDVIMFTASDSTTGLDFYDFEKQQADKSEGRFPDGTDTWQVFDEPTSGISNNGTSDVEENQSAIPNEFFLYQNYPNPFNPSTSIKFDLPAECHVNVSVFNIIGQKIAVLMDDFKNAGFYELKWNASRLSSGMYFYAIRVEETEGNKKIYETRKMVLMK